MVTLLQRGNGSASALKVETASAASALNEKSVPKTLVVSDWEGPWVTADHAFDVTNTYLPEGGKLFGALSDYVLYLSQIRRAESHRSGDTFQPGDTLALVAPFLVAGGVGDMAMRSVSAADANFINGAEHAISTLQAEGSAIRIISTSYSQYLSYTANMVGIPERDTTSTKFPIDSFRLKVTDQDRHFLNNAARMIVNLPRLSVKPGTEHNISEQDKVTISLLDDLFFSTLPSTTFGPILQAVMPIGGQRKFDALRKIIANEGTTLEKTIVVGDSITDWVMLREARDSGALAISFNGNDWAVRNSTLAVMTDNCMTTPMLAQIFSRGGMEELRKIVRDEGLYLPGVANAASNGFVDKQVYHAAVAQPDPAAKVYWVNDKNVQELSDASSEFRKCVRGNAIGSMV